MEKRRILPDILSGICASGALSFMLFIYAPLELYSANKKEMWFDAYQMLPFMLVFFCAVFGISCLLFAIWNRISPKQYKIGLTCYFITFLCTYVQGNFLIGNLPPLDGTLVNWDDYENGRIATVILWAVVIAAVLILLKVLGQERFYTAVKYITLCMTLMLAVTLVSICISNKTFVKKLNYNVSTRNQFEMSEDKNFIILLLDAFDGPAFSEQLSKNPEYEEIFEDFTYYSNTMSAYPYTMYSVPFILSGNWYENDEDFQDYENGVYKDSALFARLEADNYKMSVYEAELTSQDESIFRFDNVYETELYLTSFWEFAKQEVKLIGFRYAPFDWKRFCVIKQTGYDVLRGMKENEYEFFEAANITFFENMNQKPLTYVSDKNCFKFIHLEGPHLPYRYDKNMNIIDVESGSYEQNIQASITLTKAYLEKLKEGNAYDNSVIIIMSDHGYNQDNGSVGRQCPILLIKGMGEEHEFTISEAPISHADLMEAYFRLLDGKSSDEIFDYREGDLRERRYLFHTYEREDLISEQIQTGMAWDLSTLLPTGKEFNLH